MTVIGLDITSPAENSANPIVTSTVTGKPVMPALNATAQADGYSADTSALSLNWNLQVNSHTVTSVLKAKVRTPVWSDRTTTTKGTTTGTAQSWQPDYSTIDGGIARLAVTATVPGVLDNPVTSDPVWFSILGSNPSAVAIQNYIADPDNIDPAYANTFTHIVCHESTTFANHTKYQWVQFVPAPQNAKPAIPVIKGIPSDWKPNPGANWPLFGPPSGIGLAQVDPADPDDYWDWQQDLTDGIDIFINIKLKAAKNWQASEQGRLTYRLKAAENEANVIRRKKDLPLLDLAVVKVPKMTDAEILRDAIRLYNGGHEYRFDYDYYVVGQKVVHPGTGEWREGEGVWSGKKTITKPMTWVPQKNPNYVNDVESCS